jgi:O-antigen/teichoic acid export membrane protein
MAILMLCCTILSAPLKALFIARENIVYIAIVEIMDGVLKLLFAIGLYYVSVDKLLVYAGYMVLIQILNILAYAIYARIRFAECKLTIRRKNIDKGIIRQLAGFAGWNTYSAGAIAARSQGIAVIINHFMGTAINAAYGIAAQVHSSVAFVSTSIINAMNPQIMKAEGAGDRQKVLMLAGQESKYSVALLSMACIPLLMELPNILQIWLKEVPENTAMFCTFTLITCLLDQFTIGLNAVNQAQGRIRNYTLITFTPKLLNIPMAWLVLLWEWPIEIVMWIMLITETLMAIFRLPYLKRTAGLNIGHFLRHYVLPLIPLIATLLIVSWGCTQLFHFHLRFILTIIISILCGGISALFFTLSKKERDYVVALIKSKARKQ